MFSSKGNVEENNLVCDHRMNCLADGFFFRMTYCKMLKKKSLANFHFNNHVEPILILDQPIQELNTQPTSETPPVQLFQDKTCASEPLRLFQNDHKLETHNEKANTLQLFVQDKSRLTMIETDNNKPKTIFYTFHHLLDQSKIQPKLSDTKEYLSNFQETARRHWTLESRTNETWENTRFLLERKFRLSPQFTNGKGPAGYLTATRFSGSPLVNKLLDDQDYLFGQDCLVLKINPIPYGTPASRWCRHEHIPLKYLQQQCTTRLLTLTEEERIAEISDHQAPVLVETRHPSFYHSVALQSSLTTDDRLMDMNMKKIHGIPKK
jgi:hypothetical protein